MLIPPPPPPPSPPVETNRWETIESDLDVLLKGGCYVAARALISDYVTDEGTNKLSSALSSSLDLHIRRSQLASLLTTCSRPKATAKQVADLVSLAAELGQTKNLTTTLSATLTAKKGPSVARCEAILTIARELKDPSLQNLTVATYAKVSNYKTTEKACFRLVDLYIEYGQMDKAIEALKEFTTKNGKSAPAWLELSALLAMQKKTDESLEALKTAVSIGGDDTRKKAREDTRFESLKDTWTFKWNTR
jgi:tetratricopeptide (TPR) repeat protein